MKRRGTRGGRVRCESPPLALAAYGSRDYNHELQDQKHFRAACAGEVTEGFPDTLFGVCLVEGY
jgi:hypothetical protein